MQAPPSATLDRPTDLLVEDRGGIRILSLSRGKANALSTDFAHALHNAALAAQEDDSVRGVVLTSTNPKIFSAGFDLRKLAHATDEEFARFVRVFDALFFDLFLLGKPLVVALTGHAIAGGRAPRVDGRFPARGPGAGHDRPPGGHARDPRSRATTSRRCGRRSESRPSRTGRSSARRCRSRRRARSARSTGSSRPTASIEEAVVLRPAPRRRVERGLRGDQARPARDGVRARDGHPAGRAQGVRRVVVLRDGPAGARARPRALSRGARPDGPGGARVARGARPRGAAPGRAVPRGPLPRLPAPRRVRDAHASGGRRRALRRRGSSRPRGRRRSAG